MTTSKDELQEVSQDDMKLILYRLTKVEKSLEKLTTTLWGLVVIILAGVLNLLLQQL